MELIKARGPQRALRNHAAIGASKCENRPGNYFKRTNCVICLKACAEMCTPGIKFSLLCVIFTGPRICDLPVRAAPKTREPRSRRQQLPRVLHAAPSTAAGGLAGAPRAHAHLWLRHASFVHHILFTTTRQVRSVLLQHQTTAQRPAICHLSAATGRETRGARGAAEHHDRFSVQDQRPGDSGRRAAQWISGLCHHSGAAVPGGHVEHLQGQHSDPPV